MPHFCAAVNCGRTMQSFELIFARIFAGHFHRRAKTPIETKIRSASKTQKFIFLSNYIIFYKDFITYIVIWCNNHSFIEIKNLRWSWPLSSAPDDKSIGTEYCQKISEQVSPIPISILHTKSIADTCANIQKVSPILLVAIPILRY